MSVILSLLFSMFFGGKIIRYIKRKQIGETIRNLGIEGQIEKEGTPTMGGVIIILSTLIPCFLFADIANVYIILLVTTTLWMGFIGFLDDYIKIFKKNKNGLNAYLKISGQVILGLIVGLTLYFHQDVVVRHNEDLISQAQETTPVKGNIKSTKTTIPFLKNIDFDYKYLIKWLGQDYEKYTWIIFVFCIIFITTSVSNGANLTDGLDGLATGISAIIGGVLVVLSWVSSNVIYADYLNIMYIPHSEEIVVFTSSFVGALVGFLWYNSYPARVFMGDTGSLMIGAVIAVISICIRKELLIPILCGVFLVENLSVILQVGYFKYTRIRFNEGKRFFRMAPLHHHYQKKGIHENQVVMRFLIVGIILAVLTVVTLKIR
ncbi:phospho-N-acetylmuramoyl-pentapeptide-transferase [Ichthyobacterium seriolicida]|uniref:Phospho-N-acetylmuramoyl-pentapeptide-transferase n=2 Tax=Ichthyobacterium seriolicida TaxID=242600 RepID=A0A1J1ECL8_9FLAO|nr:phospho-N-acetylmuramoyl-pentapeptide-transferase [Ichthyobacterium seriolicida]